MITGHISIKYIVEKLYRDLGINQELPFDDIVEWVSEALLFIGAFDQFESKTVKLDIDNHKSKLPSGLYKLQLVTYNGIPIKYAGNSLINNVFCEDCNVSSICSDESFYINDYYVFTSFEEGELCITYLSTNVDSEGYPTVPDDIYYQKACASYVTKMIDYQDWRKGRIADKVFQKSEADWDWYCAAARGSANQPDMHRMEELKNTIVRLIPEQNRWHYLMKNSREAKKIQ